MITGQRLLWIFLSNSSSTENPWVDLLGLQRIERNEDKLYNLDVEILRRKARNAHSRRGALAALSDTAVLSIS